MTPASLCMSAHHVETSADSGYMPSLPWAYENNNKRSKVKNMLVSATRLKILRSKYLLSLHGPKIVEKQCQNKPEILINIFILLSPCVFGRSKIWEANPLVPKTNNMPC